MQVYQKFGVPCGLPTQQPFLAPTLFLAEATSHAKSWRCLILAFPGSLVASEGARDPILLGGNCGEVWAGLLGRLSFLIREDTPYFVLLDIFVGGYNARSCGNPLSQWGRHGWHPEHGRVEELKGRGSSMPLVSCWANAESSYAQTLYVR